MKMPLSKEHLRSIGKRIREIQRRNNIVDKDMGDLLGIGVKAYRKIIYGESLMSIEQLMAICKHLGVDYAYILDGVGETRAEALLNRIQIYAQELIDRMSEDGNEL